MLAPNDNPVFLKIEAAAALAKAARTGAEGLAAAAFCRLFHAHVPKADILARTVEALASQALSAFGLAASRDGASPVIRVWTPKAGAAGWDAGRTVVEIVNDDMPFLVDSIVAELNRRDLTVHLLIHPVMQIQRDGGKITAAGGRAKGGNDESVMQIHVDERTSQSELTEISESIRAILGDVRAGVEDWQAIRGKVALTIQDLAHTTPQGRTADDSAEAADFLAWLDDDHFTFLGYCEYAYSGAGETFTVTPNAATGLGLLRADSIAAGRGPMDLNALAPSVLANLSRPSIINVIKSTEYSTIHRPAQLDYISAQVFDDAGAVIGERRFLGLFTSTVYTTSPKRIPMLRRKVAEAVYRAADGRGSHDEKALTHILETYPRDELFQVDVDKLTDIAAGILNLQERLRTALFIRRDVFGRFASALIYVPRDRYDTALRLRMGKIIAKAYGGKVMSFATHIADDPLARVHLVVNTLMDNAESVDVAQIEAELIAVSRSWADDLESAFIAAHGETSGLALNRRFASAFPAGYRETTSPDIAARDAGLIEAQALPHGLALDLLRPSGAPDRAVHFKLFHRGAPAPLSDVLPMLEDAGLRILTETPTEVCVEGEQPVWMHYFVAETSDGRAIDITSVQARFMAGFEAVWRGEAESDSLNHLILNAGLNWRQVALVRAFSRYLRQAGATFSLGYMEETLNNNPEIAGLIVQHFEARFDPAKADAAKADAARQAVLDALEGVASLEEDRILRRFLNLVDAALRTNLWQVDAEGAPKPYLVIKFDSGAIDELPLPRPMAEIFVYSPRMEGVHLRGGKVARGGIRWSDRREDFRTEILGLMKAQMVKNTVIVPVGAKGGFVVKQPPKDGGREAFQAEGIACYKMLICGMLDITDNIVDDVIQHPANTIRADGDDPYIVAAADKGTATFSDIANGISEDYGYWLEDAFASGGSAGYDHKKMGITARGAWESVKRMFLESGKDIQVEPFTTVGCGDMSGDVFGNGMLLSDETKLIAAFNHMHIFVDPTPNIPASYAERKRLFDMGRSQWSDYDATLISKGGAIFDRSAKSITLSDEAVKALGAPSATLTPNELINTILKAPVELLWFGGIGSYIKAASESHQDAGDKANDTIRVNGAEIRAHVVGEGANMGVTQLGRVEYAQAGGSINTDFIDNSAGVDASDHEVNLKILLGRMVRSGDMTGSERDALLAQMTDEIAHLILRNNYLQGQALSLEEMRAPERLNDHIQFMRALERQGRLNRAVEFLPEDEALAEREAEGKGLTRPELAILLSYAKLSLYDELLASDLPDDFGLGSMLLHYFPAAIRKRFPAEVAAHPLAREITATLATNEIVDRLGPTFTIDTAAKTGRSTSDVARAFAITLDIFQLRGLYRQIESLDGPGWFPLQAEMFAGANRLARRSVAWLLRKPNQSLSIASNHLTLAGPIAAISNGLQDVLSVEITADIDERVSRWTAAGVGAGLARTIAQLDPLASALDIAQIAEAADVPDILDAARTYFATGSELKLAWCRSAALALEATNAWERMAADSNLDDLYSHQADIARNALTAGGLPKWMEQRNTQLDQLHRILDDMAQAEKPNSAMISVANGLYRTLSAS